MKPERTAPDGSATQARDHGRDFVWIRGKTPRWIEPGVKPSIQFRGIPRT